MRKSSSSDESKKQKQSQKVDSSDVDTNDLDENVPTQSIILVEKIPPLDWKKEIAINRVYLMHPEIAKEVQLKLKLLGLKDKTESIEKGSIEDLLLESQLIFEKILGNKSIKIENTDIRHFQLIEYPFDYFEEFPHNLSVEYLENKIIPYIKAISIIQSILDTIENRDRRKKVLIKAIFQFSPISVSLEGAAEAVDVVKDMIIPWRRKHKEILAKLFEQEKLAEIEIKKAEVFEKRARALKEREETKNLIMEAKIQEQKAKKLMLENEKLRLEVEKNRVQLILDILAQFGKNLTEQERLSFAVKLIKPVAILTNSDIELSFKSS
jgi:hypothetical protein